MRAVGVAVFVAGAVATGYAVRASFGARRGRALAAGLSTTLTVLVALTGLLLCFVPDFFS